MDTGLTYVACPYWHPDPSVRAARFDAANRVAGTLAARGIPVFSPISHGHPIQAEAAGSRLGGWDYWGQVDLAVFECCSSMVVVAIDGWDRSVGIAAELGWAEARGIPVSFVDINGKNIEGLLP